MDVSSHPGDTLVLEAAHFQELIEALRRRGYTLVGPTVRDKSIVYDVIEHAHDLPTGWTDNHGRGRYALERRADEAWFGYVVGPHSWKKYLHPPQVTLWRARQTRQGWEPLEEESRPPRYAFLGVRACELAAIAVQDKVFMGPHGIDPIYSARRAGVFIVAVNCGQAGANCFCASMGTGPAVTTGYDLALTEMVEAEAHHFVVAVGSTAGAEVMGEVQHRAATETDRARAKSIVAETAEHMGRAVRTEGLKEALQAGYQHPAWQAVAGRCLACANCTMVCPTCFCATVEDERSLTGDSAERVRVWDSCFNLDFSYIHGGPIRPSVAARYRQWATHKFAGWIDQFGTSGCVGCGRCITWCPAAIDITEEIAVVSEQPMLRAAS